MSSASETNVASNPVDLVPKWINSHCLDKHLQHYFGDTDITIVNYEVKPATASGENFASDLFRVKVTYSEDESVRIFECFFFQYSAKKHFLSFFTNIFLATFFD